MSTPDLDEQRSSPEIEDRLKEEGVASLPPSATLLVANVNQQATEEEISSVFSRLMRVERERERERERE